MTDVGTPDASLQDLGSGLIFRIPVSLQEAGSSDYVSVPQKNPRGKETHVGLSDRIMSAGIVAFALFLIVACVVWVCI